MDNFEGVLDFGPKKKIKCIHCGKEKGVHLAHSFLCPIGSKTRIGYTTFGKSSFEAKVVVKKVLK